LREVAGGLVTAIVVSLLMKTSSRPGIFIPSASMEPTLHGCSGCAGDKVLVNRATTHPGGAHRGDIVVFRDSAGWLATASSTPSPQGCVHDALAFIGLAPATSQSDLIKYVIGVGGDTVEGKGGRALRQRCPAQRALRLPRQQPHQYRLSGDCAGGQAVGNG
jgi:signal peptidase I